MKVMRVQRSKIEARSSKMLSMLYHGVEAGNAADANVTEQTMQGIFYTIQSTVHLHL